MHCLCAGSSVSLPSQDFCHHPGSSFDADDGAQHRHALCAESGAAKPTQSEVPLPAPMPNFELLIPFQPAILVYVGRARQTRCRRCKEDLVLAEKLWQVARIWRKVVDAWRAKACCRKETAARPRLDIAARPCTVDRAWLARQCDRDVAALARQAEGQIQPRIAKAFDHLRHSPRCSCKGGRGLRLLVICCCSFSAAREPTTEPSPAQPPPSLSRHPPRPRVSTSKLACATDAARPKYPPSPCPTFPSPSIASPPTMMNSIRTGAPHRQ